MLSTLQQSDHDGIYFSEVIVCGVHHFVAFVHRSINDSWQLAYNLRKALNVEPLVSKTEWQGKEGVVVVGRNDNSYANAYDLLHQVVEEFTEE